MNISKKKIRWVICGVIPMLYVLNRLEGFPIFTASLGKTVKMNRFLIYLRHLK